MISAVKHSGYVSFNHNKYMNYVKSHGIDIISNMKVMKLPEDKKNRKVYTQNFKKALKLSMKF